MKETLPRFLVRHTSDLLECLVLEHWHVFIKCDPKLACTMQIEIDHRYIDAEISWGRKIVELWKDENREYIIRCLTHEVCHLITSELVAPFQTKGVPIEHYEERVTETVSRIAFRLYTRWMKERGLTP
jgi:hypothetical protein